MSDRLRMLSWKDRFADTRPAPTSRPSRQKSVGENHLANSGFMKILLRGLILSLFVLGATVHAQTRELSARGQLLDRVAAVVNEGVVLSSQLEKETDQVSERLRQQKTELPPRNVLRKQVLERLVMQEIQVQRADR